MRKACHLLISLIFQTRENTEDELVRQNAHITTFIFRNEISVISKRTAIQSSIDALSYSATPLATPVSVITMVLNVFMPLSFMGVLQLSGTIVMTSGLMVTYDAYVSLGKSVASLGE